MNPSAPPSPAQRMAGGRPFLWIASYPKSGNTWVRLLLANFLADSERPLSINRLEDSLPSITTYGRNWFDKTAGLWSSEFTEDEIEALRPAALRAHVAQNPGQRWFCKIHDALHDTVAGEPLFPEDLTAGAIYLVRNPLDVVVSYGFHNDEDDLSMTVKGLSDPGFRRSDMWGGYLRQRLSDWSSHVESWLAAPFPVLLVRYEDLLADAAGQFVRLLRFLGLDGAADRRRLERAVAAADFTELQEQEALEGFKERSLNSQRFFRSGRSGDWRRHLTEAQVLQVTRRHGRVMRACGYDPQKAAEQIRRQTTVQSP